MNQQNIEKVRRFGVFKLIDFAEHYLQIWDDGSEIWTRDRSEASELWDYYSALDKAKQVRGLVVDLNTAQLELPIQP